MFSILQPGYEYKEAVDTPAHLLSSKDCYLEHSHCHAFVNSLYVEMRKVNLWGAAIQLMSGGLKVWILGNKNCASSEDYMSESHGGREYTHERPAKQRPTTTNQLGHTESKIRWFCWGSLAISRWTFSKFPIFPQFSIPLCQVQLLQKEKPWPENINYRTGQYIMFSKMGMSWRWWCPNGTRMTAVGKVHPSTCSTVGVPWAS